MSIHFREFCISDFTAVVSLSLFPNCEMGESGQKCDYMHKDEFLTMVIGTVNFVGQIELFAEF